MAELDTKEQFAELVRMIRAQSEKIEVVNNRLETLEITVDRIIAKPVTILDASSPTPTVAMVSSAGIHDAAPPSTELLTRTTELVSEFPARCATPTPVHEIGLAPAAATPLCTKGVSAPSRSDPPAPARRLAAAFELDKRTPAMCSMMGSGDAVDDMSAKTDASNNKSTSGDAFGDNSPGVDIFNDNSTSEAAVEDKGMGSDTFHDERVIVPLSWEVPSPVVSRPCAVPNLDALAHTRCSTECFDINVGGNCTAKVPLLREIVFLGNFRPGKVQLLRPVPWLEPIPPRPPDPLSSSLGAWSGSRPEASAAVQSAGTTVLLCSNDEEVPACLLYNEVLQLFVQKQSWPPPGLEVLCSIDIHNWQLTNAGSEVSPCPVRLITEIHLDVFVSCSVLEVHTNGYAPSFLVTYLLPKEAWSEAYLCKLLLRASPGGLDDFRWEIAWVRIVLSCACALTEHDNLTVFDSVSNSGKKRLQSNHCSSVFPGWKIALSRCYGRTTEFQASFRSNMVSVVPVEEQKHPGNEQALQPVPWPSFAGDICKADIAECRVSHSSVDNGEDQRPSWPPPSLVLMYVMSELQRYKVQWRPWPPPLPVYLQSTLVVPCAMSQNRGVTYACQAICGDLISGAIHPLKPCFASFLWEIVWQVEWSGARDKLTMEDKEVWIAWSVHKTHCYSISALQSSNVTTDAELVCYYQVSLGMAMLDTHQRKIFDISVFSGQATLVAEPVSTELLSREVGFHADLVCVDKMLLQRHPTQLLQILGDCSFSPDCKFVNALCNSSMASPVLSWLGNGKQRKCVWAAEQLLGEQRQLCGANFLPGVMLTIGSGEANMQYATGWHSLSADWRLLGVAEWKRMNQVAGNCKQPGQQNQSSYQTSLPHTIQRTAHVSVKSPKNCLVKTHHISVGLSPWGDQGMCIPNRGRTGTWIGWTYKVPWKLNQGMHEPSKSTGESLSLVLPSVQSQLAPFICKSSMIESHERFAVAPMLDSGLFTQLAMENFLDVIPGRDKLVYSPEHGSLLPWQSHLCHLLSRIPAGCAKSIPVLTDRAATGHRYGSDLGHCWNAAHPRKRPDQYEGSTSPRGHKLRAKGATLITWLCAPWDPGGSIFQVFADDGLRASRLLRGGECHVPIVTWAIRWTPLQESWAAGGYQAHFARFGILGRSGRRPTSYLGVERRPETTSMNRTLARLFLVSPFPSRSHLGSRLSPSIPC